MNIRYPIYEGVYRILTAYRTSRPCTKRNVCNESQSGTARVPTPRPQTGAESKRIYPSSSKILFMAAISKKRFTNKVLSNGFR